jgi:hypothetical protein
VDNVSIELRCSGSVLHEEEVVPLQTIALIWGLLSIAGMFVAFMPCLGSLNWLNIPFAVVGLILAIIGVSNSRPGRRGTGIAALILNLAAVVLGALRLMAGGFIF